LIMVKRFSTVRRAKKANKVDKSAKNVDNHAFLCKSMDIKMTQITYSWLSTKSGDNFSTISTSFARPAFCYLLVHKKWG